MFFFNSYQIKLLINKFLPDNIHFKLMSFSEFRFDVLFLNSERFFPEYQTIEISTQHQNKTSQRM